MFKPISKPAVILAVFCLILCQNAYPAITSLPTTPAVGMSTLGFGTGQSYEHMYYYINTNGGPGGSVQNFYAPVYYADPTPGDTDLSSLCGGVACEKLGNLSFQNVLWDGAGNPPNATNLAGGAITLGGFNLTDSAEGGNYAFLQIYTDNSAPGGVIDGGSYYGKVNADIPGYNSSPYGWSPNGTQYNYLDIPYDVVNQSQGVVSFETALVKYDANTVYILADFTWGYTTGVSANNCSGVGGSATCFGVTAGNQLTLQPTASQTLLNLYSAQYGAISYINQNAPAAIPLPAPFGLFSTMMGCYLATGARARRLACWLKGSRNIF